jgi:aminopeptidase
MQPEVLARYADAIVRDALRIGDGQVLAIHSEAAHRPFCLALVEAGYRAGADRVDLLYSEPEERHLRGLLAPEEALGCNVGWVETRMQELLESGAAIVWVAGESQPGLLSDVAADRAAKLSTENIGARKRYLGAVSESQVRFCVTAHPTAAWATRVFPELDEQQALDALERDLVAFARIGADDGADGWARHVAELEGVAAELTGRELRELHLTGPGTDLHLRLPEGTVWRGGTLPYAEGRFSPNVPTEEIFTSPSPQGTEGRFACTRPLSVQGRIIDGIRGVFAAGTLVEIDADDPADASYLRQHLARDEGAGRLGEIALVDGRSRVGATGRTYGMTLLDENAASHIAFGSGFQFGRRPGSEPVNESGLHLDVMIGSPELEVRGVDASGTPLDVLVGGRFTT